jgi:hypothetical protein
MALFRRVRMSSHLLDSKKYAVESYEPQPLLETIWPIVSKLDLKPLTNYKGVDITELENIKKPLMEGSILCFYTDKIEKLILAHQVFMKRMSIKYVMVYPHDDYDFPFFAGEVDEAPSHAFFILDMHPLQDIVVDSWYREKYLDPVEPIWKEYLDLHNDINPFAWFRAFLSPFAITGRHKPKNADRSELSRLTESTAKYLEYYVNHVIPEAEPVKDPQAKEFAVRKKNAIRETYKTKDPGGGALIKALGAELFKKVVHAIY